MLMDHSSAQDVVGATITRVIGASDKVAAGGVFTVQCVGADGQVKWEESLKNLVVNQGLQDMNTKYFKGSTYTATWYVGLYGAAASNNPVAGDTAASHAGFTEVTDYSNATRPVATFDTATTADPSVISTTVSPAVFMMNGSTTVGGAFLISDNTKGGAAGVLFSASDFAAPGDRAVINGDQISVGYTFSLDAA
jgi:hypothetical protein